MINISQKSEMEILQEIADTTKEMRTNQKAYFKYRSSNFLNKSKELESKVDLLIKDLDLHVAQLLANRQQSLFSNQFH